jgi:hypothetical protein
MAFLGLPLVASGSAHGADTPAAEEAKALFAAGVKLMDAGDYERARLKFIAANALVKSPTVLWNLGYCEVRSHHDVDGVRHLRQYAREPRASAEHLKAANATYIPEALLNAGDLQIDAPPGARVVIDGKDDVGAAPLPDPVAVEPGKHRVEAQIGADTVAVKDLDIPAGQSLHVVLARSAPAATPPAAPVAQPASIDAQPSAPAAPAHDAPPAATGHSLSPRVWLTLGLGVGAVAALGVGVGFGVASQNDTNQVSSLRASSACAAGCADLSSARDSQRGAANAADAFYVVGGVLAAGSIGLLTSLFISPDRRSGQALVYPVVFNGGGGVVVHAPF